MGPSAPSRPADPAAQPPETSTAPSPAEAPTQTPESMPIAVPAPRAPHPGTVPTTDLEAPRIRVLLRRSSEPIELPEPGRAWRVSADGADSWLWGPLTLSVVRQAGWFQVGAFGDLTTAAGAIDTLTAVFGDSIEVRTETSESGLERVQVRWTNESLPAEPLAALAATGFGAAFAVPAAEGQLVVEGRDGRIGTSREAVLEAAGEYPLAVESRRYRGRLRARTSDGKVLVINELNLERYLLGVVPLEMGPAVFPELDALKAQAVAARTYAVAHLGDHDDEGYDICDTPACQVYGGSGGEHPLSNRAVEETSGVIAVYEGAPIDAMYTSTCGGRSEASSELFSGRAQPYLQPVDCAWERPLQLRGSATDGPWTDRTGFAAALAQRVLALAGEPSPVEILQAVAGLVGTGPFSGQAPTDGDAFATALLVAAGLEKSAAVLTPEPPDLASLLFLTDLYGVDLDPPTAEGRDLWYLAAAFAVLEVRGEVERDSGEAVMRADGVGIFPRRAAKSETLPSIVAVWERWREGFRRRAAVEVLPGTELERYRMGETVLAVVARRSGGDGEADRRSAWREWVRDKPWSELAKRLEIPDLEKLEITRRTPSGRVVGLAAEGRSGERRQWQGFDVRRVLDLPETLFTVHVIRTADGERVARFLGRGWGHGVGLCQNGAYGLARAGRTFEQILGHYYTGIELVRWHE